MGGPDARLMKLIDYLQREDEKQRGAPGEEFLRCPHCHAIHQRNGGCTSMKCGGNTDVQMNRGNTNDHLNTNKVGSCGKLFSASYNSGDKVRDPVPADLRELAEKFLADIKLSETPEERDAAAAQPVDREQQLGELEQQARNAHLPIGDDLMRQIFREARADGRMELQEVRQALGLASVANDVAERTSAGAGGRESTTRSTQAERKDAIQTLKEWYDDVHVNTKFWGI